MSTSPLIVPAAVVRLAQRGVDGERPAEFATHPLGVRQQVEHVRDAPRIDEQFERAAKRGVIGHAAHAEALAPVGVAEHSLNASEAQAEHLAKHEACEELREREVLAAELAGIRAKRASAEFVRPPHHRPRRLRGQHRA
jgi:hypothetical protein